jgi:hypothetical protein
MFGSGLGAAFALRARILESVGAGEADAAVAAWEAGPGPTYLAVESGAEVTPDLAVLRVVTRAGTTGDMRAVLAQCAALNARGGTSRWTAEPVGPGEDGWFVRASCSFAVGPHNAGALESFILACVRELGSAMYIAPAYPANCRPDATGAILAPYRAHQADLARR